jgi:hypothetical protein
MELNIQYVETFLSVIKNEVDKDILIRTIRKAIDEELKKPDEEINGELINMGMHLTKLNNKSYKLF